MLSGMTIDVIPEFANGLPPNELIEAGISTVFKLEQPLNVLDPRVSNVLGTLNVSSAVQSLKKPIQYSPKADSSSKVTVLSLVLLANTPVV